jgi:hypothetical protein
MLPPTAFATYLPWQIFHPLCAGIVPRSSWSLKMGGDRATGCPLSHPNGPRVFPTQAWVDYLTLGTGCGHPQ